MTEEQERIPLEDNQGSSWTFRGIALVIVIVVAFIAYMRPNLSMAGNLAGLGIQVVLLVTLPLLITIWIDRLIHWGFQKHNQDRAIGYYSRLSDSNKQLIAVAMMFYSGLILVLVVTSQVFANEWAIIFAASIPLIIYVLGNTLNGLPVSRVKIGNLEFEFLESPTVKRAETEEFRTSLDESDIDDESDTQNNEKLETDSESIEDYHENFADRSRLTFEQKRSNRLKMPYVQLVILDSDNEQMNLLSLVDYVRRHEYIQGIVFTDESKDYLSIIPASDFMQAYQRQRISLTLGLDVRIYRGVVEESEARQHGRQLDMFDEDAVKRGRDFDAFLASYEELIRSTSHRTIFLEGNRLARRIEFRNLSRTKITAQLLKRLGASESKVKEGATILEVYRTMLKDNVRTVLVVDEDGRFQDVIEIDDIAEEFVKRLERQVKQ
jgi:CBS domain-containing protein